MEKQRVVVGMSVIIDPIVSYLFGPGWFICSPFLFVAQSVFIAY